MNWVSRFGASRKSSALREGGRVEDEEVVAALLVDLEELLHRHVLLASRRGRWRSGGRSGSRGCGRASPRRARACGRARRRSPWRRASSPRARPASRRPRCSNSFGSTCRGSLPSSSSPSESASRFAGSIVSTATLLPARGQAGRERRRGGRLADAARAGADATRLPSRISPTFGTTRAAAARRSSAGDVEARLEDEGQGLDGRAHGLRRAASSCSRCGRARRYCGERRADRGRGGALGDLAARRSSFAASSRRSARVHARSCRRGRPRRRPRRSSCLLERGRLVDRHLLGQGDDRDAGRLVVGDEAVELAGPGSGSGPTRAMPAKVRGVCRKPMPCPVAGASTITRSYSRRLLHLAVVLGQLPDLADRDQLLQPGGGGGEVVEDPRADQQVAHRAHLELEQQVLAHATRRGRSRSPRGCRPPRPR